MGFDEEPESGFLNFLDGAKGLIGDAYGATGGRVLDIIDKFAGHAGTAIEDVGNGFSSFALWIAVGAVAVIILNKVVL